MTRILSFLKNFYFKNLTVPTYSAYLQKYLLSIYYEPGLNDIAGNKRGAVSGPPERSSGRDKEKHTG